MPDKSRQDPTGERPVRPPKQPPKAPRHDYSALPQKPIKLKTDVSLPPALKKSPTQPSGTKPSGTKSPKSKRGKPNPASKAKPKRTGAPPETTDVLSPAAMALANTAAAEQGLTLQDWLENLVVASTSPLEPSASDALETIEATLTRIEQRLERLENQRGFWSRFWEQFMEPLRRR